MGFHPLVYFTDASTAVLVRCSSTLSSGQWDARLGLWIPFLPQRCHWVIVCAKLFRLVSADRSTKANNVHRVVIPLGAELITSHKQLWHPPCCDIFNHWIHSANMFYLSCSCSSSRERHREGHNIGS